MFLGESNGKLISPCRCAGTMGLVHAACIEKWLSATNSAKCELCNYPFVITQQPRPFKDVSKEIQSNSNHILLPK